MKLSVIIVSWNVRDLLKKCLESIFGLSRGVAFEVIVVDNGSNDGSPDMVGRDFSQVRLISLDKNIGFAGANNVGIRQAQGEYILLLNPDTEFIEDTLAKVIEKMEQNKSIGILGCKLLNPDKSIQSSVRRFPTIASQLAILSKLNYLFPSLLNKYLMKDFDYTSPPDTTPYPLLKEEGTTVEVDQVMGAFFCVRREVFDKIGLLDEGYFLWFEEVDFCWRVKRAGWRVVYSPVTQVVHHGGQSFSQQMTLKKQWWFFISGIRFLLKKYFT